MMVGVRGQVQGSEPHGQLLDRCILVDLELDSRSRGVVGRSVVFVLRRRWFDQQATCKDET